MKTLIIGRSGQLAQALSSVAPETSEVVMLGRESADITDSKEMTSIIAELRPAVIFNAAAYTAVDKAEHEEDAAFRLNRDAPAVLADVASRLGARFVHVSTDFVFNGDNGVPYKPDDATSPVSVYGRSKLAGEEAVRQANADALIVRTAWVYGAHGANFMKTMLRLMDERSQVNVVSDQIGTPTHSVSLARALWALAQTDASGTHHFTDAGVASWYDFAVAIKEEALAAGLLQRSVPVNPIRSRDYPTPARRPAYSVLDKESCWNLLGQPSAHWRVELRKAMTQLSPNRALDC